VQPVDVELGHGLIIKKRYEGYITSRIYEMARIADTAAKAQETTDMGTTARRLPVIVAGGGIGGVAAALALTRRGFDVTILEQAAELGEIGAGIQFGPNAFAALDALGVGPLARSRAVYTDEMVMHDAIDETCVGRIPTGEAFRARFGNPYAVIHRADVHGALLEGAQADDRIRVLTSTTVQRVEQDDDSVTVHDTQGRTHRGLALIGADGVKSAVRRQYVGDDARVSGHVVYRAVIDRADFPVDLQWNAASIWVGPNCHLVHYPLRGGEQYNVVVTFHSREREEWSVREGSREEVQSYFEGICPKARQLIDLPRDWKRWATADREPIAQWTHGRAVLLGDAAHPTLQYLAQGACMALEDAVTLGEALRVTDDDFGKAFALYQRSRVARTARVVLSAREMGRIFHAKGVERLVRNELWAGRSPERFYDAMEWLYGWSVATCLAR
jgi:salicylate hydroxylase